MLVSASIDLSFSYVVALVSIGWGDECSSRLTTFGSESSAETFVSSAGASDLAVDSAGAAPPNGVIGRLTGALEPPGFFAPPGPPRPPRPPLGPIRMPGATYMKALAPSTSFFSPSFFFSSASLSFSACSSSVSSVGFLGGAFTSSSSDSDSPSNS